jgi:hypothetical protein
MQDHVNLKSGFCQMKFFEFSPITRGTQPAQAGTNLRNISILFLTSDIIIPTVNLSQSRKKKFNTGDEVANPIIHFG